MRVLSVFVAVVIVVVGFMQPVVYANGLVLAAGGALVLIVAGLLVAAGMTFSTPAQAQSTAEYAISVMPDGLESEILARVQISGDSYVLKKSKVYQMIEKGLLSTLPLPRETWEKFKAWVNETFGINAETAAAGSVVNEKSTTQGSSFLPDNAVLRVANTNGLMVNIYLPVDYLKLSGFSHIAVIDFAYSNYLREIRIYASNIPLVTGKTLWDYRNLGLSDFGSCRIISCSLNPAHETYLQWQYSDWTREIGTGYIHDNGFWGISKMYYTSADIRFADNDGIHEVYYTSLNNVSLLYREEFAVSQDAYTHTMPSGVNDVQITLPSSIDGIPNHVWKEYIANYDGVSRAEAPTADWDYRKSLDDMQKTLDGISANLGAFGAGTYDGLLNQTDAMQREIDRLNELVAAQGADVIGGTQALNDAMVEAGYVIQGLQSLLNETATADAARTAELEAEIERAKQTIKDLTDGKTGDISVPDAAEAIDWSPLTKLRSFTGVFPFCIPFDIISMVKSLDETPEAPRFEIPFKYGDYIDEKIIVDLSVVNTLIPFVRLFILMDFVIGLAWATSRVIKW